MNDDSLDEYSKFAIDIGWKWFRYHVEQRMVMIRYYIILLGVSVTAYFSVLKIQPLASVGVAIFGIIVSVLFWALDSRVSKLVKIGEAVLNKEQEKAKLVLGYDEILIVKIADSHSKGPLGSYRRAFRALFVSSIILFSAGGVLVCAFEWNEIGKLAIKSPIPTSHEAAKKKSEGAK